MRLFIAINVSHETKNGLIALQDELRTRTNGGNFTLPENLHLTLAFLGECNEAQTAAAKSAMDDIKGKPLELLIEQVGRYNRDGGDIWWAGVQVSNSLTAIHNAMTSNLINAGFVFDKRKYSPHITLARKVITAIAPWQIKPFGETVSNIELMKSERINGKLTYTAIYSKKL